MTTNTPSDNRTATDDLDYESVGAEIVASHARDEMQARVSALRRHLRTAFAATKPSEAGPDQGADDD
jgi:hypothetical protein